MVTEAAFLLEACCCAAWRGSIRLFTCSEVSRSAQRCPSGVVPGVEDLKLTGVAARLVPMGADRAAYARAYGHVGAPGLASQVLAGARASMF